MIDVDVLRAAGLDEVTIAGAVKKEAKKQKEIVKAQVVEWLEVDALATKMREIDTINFSVTLIKVGGAIDVKVKTTRK